MVFKKASKGTDRAEKSSQWSAFCNRHTSRAATRAATSIFLTEVEQQH
jgi:hypothetical protein